MSNVGIVGQIKSLMNDYIPYKWYQPNQAKVSPVMEISLIINEVII